MPDNAFSGRTAFVGTAATSSGTAVKLGGLRDFNLDVTRGRIPVVHQDSGGWEESFPGRATWSATIGACLLSTSATQEQDSWREYLSSDARRWWSFQSSSGANKIEQAGYGYVTGWTWNGDQDNPILHNFTITGDGELYEL